MNALAQSLPLGRAAWLLAGLLLLLPATLIAQPRAHKQSEQEGAKQLFYNPATGAASPAAAPSRKGQAKILKPRAQPPASEAQPVLAQHPGIHYWLELAGAGKVTDDHVFHTGDRIKLHLRSNVDGYLTLWAYDSKSGNSQLLFPAPGAEGDNQVRANQEYVLPGTIEFNPPAEDERLLLFFSQLPSDVPAPQNNRLTAEQTEQATREEGGKALSFQVEKKDQATLGSYVVSQQGGAIAREIRLKHRAR